MGMLKDFSIQLYSLRDETATDFAAVLEKIGKMDYTGVEFAGYGDVPAQRMKELLQQNNLVSVGSHISAERIQNNLQEELDYNTIIGTQNIIIPWFDLKTTEDVQALAAVIRQAAPAIMAAGFGFAYHNHAHEFEQVNGTPLLDLLLDAVPAEILSLELDVYWAAYAGVDPVAYIQKHAGRISMVHVKQMKDYTTKECCNVADGVIDFAEVIRVAQQGGTRHFVLEQESFTANPYASIQAGWQHIMSL